ncbi:hypothetical protein F9288_09695 [Sphingomonas sp. CL5.1]|uniref:hypothetical protein n=1 Tax=Sphingomonas sp. CL5.1 TaxID=2653203 RepID=UPI001581D4EF|nr:hypothetical protein [Sphingomonas sp. CL5.1]QKR99881.1 hypothetical protein F9288_09695 [Sphingomonas sp. CL5.1]
MTKLTVAIVLALGALAFTGFFFGTKFLQRKNLLLGLEWYILAISATNGVVYFLTGWQTSFIITSFCDAFSRTVGIPIIGIIGLVQAFNGWRPSHVLEAGLFAGGALVAVLVLTVAPIHEALPMGSVVLGLGFDAALILMSIALFRGGAAGHAFAVVLCALALLAIALWDGIPQDPDGAGSILLNFWVVSDLVWAIAFAEVYFAYCALEDLHWQNARQLQRF